MTIAHLWLASCGEHPTNLHVPELKKTATEAFLSKNLAKGIQQVNLANNSWIEALKCILSQAAEILLDGD
jgi:hypothetical protein